MTSHNTTSPAARPTWAVTAEAGADPVDGVQFSHYRSAVLGLETKAYIDFLKFDDSLDAPVIVIAAGTGDIEVSSATDALALAAALVQHAKMLKPGVVLESNDGSDVDGTEVDPALVPAVIAALRGAVFNDAQREVRRPLDYCSEPDLQGRGGGL